MMGNGSRSDGPAAERSPPKLAAALAAGGELGARMRTLDWSTTRVGPPGRWSPELADAVAQLICSRVPTMLFWGPDRLAFYNDACAPLIGAGHPGALGRPAREHCGELCDVLEPLLGGVMRTGRGNRAEDRPLPIPRRGRPGQAYADASCDPVRMADGTIGGVVCTVTDATARVLHRRRLATLTELGLRLASAIDVRGLCHEAMTVLGGGRADLPFAVLYHTDPDSGQTGVGGSFGVPAADVVALDRLGAGAADALGGALFGGVAGMAAAGELVSAPPLSAADRAVILPLSVGNRPAGALVAGLNRDLALDAEYRDFLHLIAASVSHGLTGARARAEPRPARPAELGRPVPTRHAGADDPPAGRVGGEGPAHGGEGPAHGGEVPAHGPAGGVPPEPSERSGRLVRQLRGLVDAAVALAAAGSTDSVLAVAADHASRLAGAGLVLISVPGGRYRTHGWPAAADEPPAAIVPLGGSSGEALGELRFWPEPARPATSTLAEVDRTVLAQLGRLIALRLENARLSAAERRMAADLQHSLLPRELPRVPGATIAGRYRAGGREAEVGGDWYDAVVGPDGCLVLVIGDVVGKGVPAAAAMGQIRNALRAYVLEGFGPAEALGRLNRLAGTLGDQIFATVACVSFDPRTGRLRLSSAGHPPPLMIEPNGRARFIHDAALGPPIGALPDVTFGTEEAHVAPAGRILLYTDGLVEDRTAGVGTGLDRLLADVALPTSGLDGLLDLMIARAAGRAPRDDMALLALEAAEVPRLNLRLPADPNELSGLRHRLERFLIRHGVPETDAFDVTLAVSEATANAIEHPIAPTEQMISIEVAVQPDEVVATIRDTGRWRTAGDQRQRGRGLALIRVLTDLSVESGGRGTAVTLRRRLS
jgi:serine phosphatase RsbU (regulator of sigma subunit)/anti-sigma regulatory factor (Ser/Thr protein kinase)